MKTLLEIIKETKGKFFTVKFIKKDKTERILTGRIGVIKHLKGGIKTTDPNKYLTVYDVQNKGYRSINLDTIKEVRFNGLIHTQNV